MKRNKNRKLNLQTNLVVFLVPLQQQRSDLTEKIEKEEVKIEGLEELFNELASQRKRKKKKKVLLVEPEKEIVPQVSAEQLVDEIDTTGSSRRNNRRNNRRKD